MRVNIKQARLLKGIKQREMAEALGIHVQTYRKIEQNPNLATIKQAKIQAL
jgi:transcriptional regulator with XRE-family HTH domain